MGSTISGGKNNANGTKVKVFFLINTYQYVLNILVKYLVKILTSLYAIY